MLHQTFLFLGQLWQLFEVSQILEFLRYIQSWSFLEEIFFSSTDLIIVWWIGKFSGEATLPVLSPTVGQGGY